MDNVNSELSLCMIEQVAQMPLNCEFGNGVRVPCVL